MNETLLSTRWGIGLLALIEILLVSIVIAFGRTRELLREGDPNQPDFTKRPYSMAKSQLAFWTVVIIGSFIYVYFAKGVCADVLNNTALLLLGISSGTTALSAAAKGPAPEVGTVPPSVTGGFFDDITSDNQGMNVHRLQMLLWTLVFGCIFVHQVVKGGKFPTFDEQAYVLMGISSATYVWFKRSEK